MSDRDPFDNLRDLIDEPVAPREAFADELRSRLMREMSASTASREEQLPSMDAVIAPRSPVAFPTESVRRIRPMVILELAAVAVIILAVPIVLYLFGVDRATIKIVGRTCVGIALLPFAYGLFTKALRLMLVLLVAVIVLVVLVSEGYIDLPKIIS